MVSCRFCLFGRGVWMCSANEAFCENPLAWKRLGLLNYFFIKTIYNIRCRLANYLYLCMIYVMKKEALEKEN
jgi:hypothetical protein